MGDTPLAHAVDQVLIEWKLLTETGEMSAQTVAKFGLLLHRFRRYAATQDASTLTAVSPTIALLFINAHGRNRRGRIAPAGIATRHLRRSVLRMFFRTARGLGLTTDDPTRDIALPPRTPTGTRPLSDDEVVALRFAAEFVDRPTRHAATAALALAGGFSGEIGHISVADLDLKRHRVWVHGSHKTHARWCTLDRWGERVLTARAGLVTQPQRFATTTGLSPYPYKLAVSSIPGRDEQLQARVCVALTDLLRRIGLSADPNVRPASVTAYAGAETYARTGRIEAAAMHLGMCSLDSTAALIGHAWATEVCSNSEGFTLHRGGPHE